MRGGRCFTLAVGGLAVLGLLTACLLTALLWEVLQNERDYRDLRQTLEQEYDAWQALQIDTYTVTYTNCSGAFCCQQAPLGIANDTILERPACAMGAATYQEYYRSDGYLYLTTMEQTYRWVLDWIEYRRGQPIRISYHPELHYITRVELQPWDGSPWYTIEYQDLTPR